jgi:hypothetical protein
MVRPAGPGTRYISVRVNRAGVAVCVGALLLAGCGPAQATASAPARATASAPARATAPAPARATASAPARATAPAEATAPAQAKAGPQARPQPASFTYGFDFSSQEPDLPSTPAGRHNLAGPVADARTVLASLPGLMADQSIWGFGVIASPEPSPGVYLPQALPILEQAPTRVAGQPAGVLVARDAQGMLMVNTTNRAAFTASHVKLLPGQVLVAPAR